MYLPKRRRPDRGVLESENRPTIVFLNVCTESRSRWLADHAIHEALTSIAFGDLLEGRTVYSDAGSSSSFCMAWDFARRLRWMGSLLEITVLELDR